LASAQLRTTISDDVRRRIVGFSEEQSSQIGRIVTEEMGVVGLSELPEGFQVLLVQETTTTRYFVRYRDSSGTVIARHFFEWDGMRCLVAEALKTRMVSMRFAASV
jgi:hypothetical protein